MNLKNLCPIKLFWISLAGAASLTAGCDPIDCSDPNETSILCDDDNDDGGGDDQPEVCGEGKVCFDVMLANTMGAVPEGRFMTLWEPQNVFDEAVDSFIGVNEPFAPDPNALDFDVSFDVIETPSAENLFFCSRDDGCAGAVDCPCKSDSAKVAVASFGIVDELTQVAGENLPEDDVLNLNFIGRSEAGALTFSEAPVSAAELPGILGSDIGAGLTVVRLGDPSAGEEEDLFYAIEDGTPIQLNIQ